MSRIAFLFPGQGAQTVGMGKVCAEAVPAAAKLFAQADQILGYSLSEICFSGPAEELDTTVYSQPGLFVCSLAAIEMLRSQSPEVVLGCEAAAGLSLGEYSALVFAGCMEFEAALQVVQIRGEAMQAAADAAPSGMVSILGLERAQVEDLVLANRGNDVLEIANLLCPGNIVVSGHNGACERIATAADKAGAMKVVPLPVAGAFHTALMQSALDRLRAALAKVPMRRPSIPVISNVDAAPHNDPEEIRDILVRQVVSQVRWEDSMRQLLSEGYARFYEVGPGRVLRGLLKRIDRQASCEGVTC